MVAYKQDAPFCIQVEMTTGCNLQCSFCGVNGFQAGPGRGLKFMTMETAHRLVAQILQAGWTSRIEFAMHGEPTLNPDWLGIIHAFRDHLPKTQLMLTTNGGPLLKGGRLNAYIREFFRAGGDILAIDMYHTAPFADKIMRELDEFELDVPVYQYPEQKEGNPHRRSGKRFVSLVQDISQASAGTHANLQNHAGSAGELDYSRTDKPCVKPFREIGVNSDGSVDVCCNDWLGEATLGNVNTTSLPEIWNGEVLQAYRRMLMSRDRVLRPCLGCSDMGYRVGLLPDKLGKATLEPFDDFDRGTIRDILEDGPSRPPVGEVARRLQGVIAEEDW